MNYHMIRTDDMLNGDGLRVVVFLSGCEHRCPGCHNPETWDVNGGKEFNNEAIEEILKEINKDYISGITLSGGDPLYKDNLKDVYSLVSCIKEKHPEKTVWLYTGFIWNQIFNSNVDVMSDMRRDIVEKCDILVDGRFIKSLTDVNCPWVGSTNQNVIDVRKTLEKGEIVLYDK